MDERRQIEMVRPYDFAFAEEHRSSWKEKDITVLICQRRTPDITRLCLESLLRFYPDIPILLVDGNSQDDSLWYMKYMAAKHANIELWQRDANPDHFTSHGVTMHDAITNIIKTTYVLLMDSDVIVERHGAIEGMLALYELTRMYAVGSVMHVSESGHACSPPKGDDDILLYAHPSFSMYHVRKYKHLNAPFCDHGAPCVYNMIEAKKRGYEVKYFPVDKYTSHLCGGSWTTPRTVWNNDHDVLFRPFITFVSLSGLDAHGMNTLREQADMDFDIVFPSKAKDFDIVTWGKEPKKINSSFYEQRFGIKGEYVCLLSEPVTVDFVQKAKQKVLELNLPDVFEVDNIKLTKRKIFQHTVTYL